MQISSTVIQAFDALIDAYANLGACLSIFGVIENVFGSNVLVQKVLVDVYKDILTFHRRALRFFRRKGRKIERR